MNIKLIKSLSFILLTIIIITSSCYPIDDDVLTEDFDVVLTYYDNERNFSDYNTFVIRDSVGIITDHLTFAEKQKFFTSGGLNETVKNKVIQQFESLGYTEVETLDDADFAVNLAIAVIENETTIIYPGYWWDYYYYDYWYWYGSYYPSWGGYYDYWYPWSYIYYSYTYEHGTLLLEMLDGQSLRDYREYMDTHTEEEIENADPNDPELPELDFFWQSLVRGILSSSTSYNEDRTLNGIEEAFEQSPYLNK